MIIRVWQLALYIIGPLAAALIGAAIAWSLKPPPPPPPKPLWNHEQITVATSALVDYLEHHDTDALDYTFPAPLGCAPRPGRAQGGMDCRFGITYVDETTRSYWIRLDRSNVPYGIGWSKRTKPRSAPY